MYKIERQEKILDYINKNNRASIAELSEMFKVSKVTIRTDLEDLEGKNLVNKTHGGVVCKDIGISSEIPYDVKTKSNIQQKQRIAKRASKFIKKGDVIILDSGSTMFQLVEWLPEGITVITTDILVAVEIAKSEKDIQIVMPGGEVQKSVYSLQGADTLRFLQSLHADKLFFCCDALDFNFGISDRSREYAAVKQVMIDAVSEVILLVDSSKFDSRLGTKVCPMERLDVMVVDKGNSEMKKNCEKMGIKLVIAE